MTNQIKSKKRVADHGEVFTNPREVNAMLDLVKKETGRIDSRFLEPACGDGNFLEEILRRKLTVVEKKYKSSQFEYEKYVLVAVSSVYGVDILEDNCLEARKRLFEVVEKTYAKLFKGKMDFDFLDSIRYILNKNIVCGDALTGLKNGTEASPIIFSEWTMLGNNIKREDYAMNDMLAYEEFDSDDRKVLKPRKTFAFVNYRGVKELG